MSADYLTDGAHALIFGITGAGRGWGGKTAVANWWFANGVEMGWFDLGIFFNAKPTSGIRGKRVESVKALHNQYMEGERLFNLVPKSLTGESEHAELWAYLEELPGSKIVVHDEAQDYEDADSLHAFVKRGSVTDAKSLVLSQRAWDLSESIRAQLVYTVYVGPTSSKYRPYFNQMLAGEAYDGISPFEHVQENHDEYQWSVFGPGDELLGYNKPVPAAYA